MPPRSRCWTSPSSQQSTAPIDQTFRLIVKPDLWGRRIRLRFSNAFGTQRVTFDDVYVGLQGSGGNIVAGTNQPAAFDRGHRTLALAPGASGFSDPIDLRIGATERRLLAGRKLAVSFHVVGASGPHDVARQGADDVLPHRSAHRQPRRRRERRKLPVHHHVVVLPRRGRGRSRRAHQRGRLLWRFDHRRHGLDAERRRPLAGRACRAGCTRRMETASRS